MGQIEFIKRINIMNTDVKTTNTERPLFWIILSIQFTAGFKIIIPMKANTILNRIGAVNSHRPIVMANGTIQNRFLINVLRGELFI